MRYRDSNDADSCEGNHCVAVWRQRPRDSTICHREALAVRSFLKSSAALGLAMAISIPNAPAEADTLFSFADASARLLAVSPQVRALSALAVSQRDQANAMRTLHLPLVTAGVGVVHVNSTLSASTSGLQSLAESAVNGVQGLFPNVPVAAAVPVGIPGSVSFGVSSTSVAPVLTGVLPIYSGGRIEATQQIARSAATQAEANRVNVVQDNEALLVEKYFGVQAAAVSARAAADAVRDLDDHFRDVRITEKAGTSTRLATLQVQASLDTAKSDEARADRALSLAQSDLRALLVADDTPIPTDPLFVDTRAEALQPIESFINTASTNSSSVVASASLLSQTDATERLARSSYLPSVIGFAQAGYNTTTGGANASPTYLVGIAASVTLVSPIDRSLTAASARASRAAAHAQAHAAQIESEESVRRAYAAVLDARDAFVYSLSSVAAAQEGVRVQTERFARGAARPADLSDAEHEAVKARTLQALLRIVRKADTFVNFMAQADVRLGP
jgi:outer membrane protein TolC